MGLFARAQKQPQTEVLVKKIQEFVGLNYRITIFNKQNNLEINLSRKK
jgi:hypothetical protein